MKEHVNIYGKYEEIFENPLEKLGTWTPPPFRKISETPGKRVQPQGLGKIPSFLPAETKGLAKFREKSGGNT